MTERTLTVDEPGTESPAEETPSPSEHMAPEATDLSAELARVAAERDEYLDALQRVKAEFENYRKRVQREQDGQRALALASVLDKLLPVLDAFDAARVHHPEALAPVDGVLHPALVALGVDRIDPLGERFDPEAHEAVAINVDDEAVAGGETVVEVLRAGYRCRGRLVRPAMVRVGEERPLEE